MDTLSEPITYTHFLVYPYNHHFLLVSVGSKLTLVLKDSFTRAKARTVMIATVSPVRTYSTNIRVTSSYFTLIVEGPKPYNWLCPSVCLSACLFIPLSDCVSVYVYVTHVCSPIPLLNPLVRSLTSALCFSLTHTYTLLSPS